MEALRLYLNSLPKREQDEFAKNCGTTLGYLRKAISKGQKLSDCIVIRAEKFSRGAVRVEQLRSDVPWHIIRNSTPHQ